MNVLAVLAEDYLQSLNEVRFIPEGPSGRKIVNSNNASVFFPHMIYGIKVKSLYIHSVKCEMSDVMVNAFVTFN